MPEHEHFNVAPDVVRVKTQMTFFQNDLILTLKNSFKAVQRSISVGEVVRKVTPEFRPGKFGVKFSHTLIAS
jgi:hypothetical protein